MKFSEIKIGRNFTHNGTLYFKKTSRTAYITPKLFFYFGKDEEIFPYGAPLIDPAYYGIPSL